MINNVQWEVWRKGYISDADFEFAKWVQRESAKMHEGMKSRRTFYANQDMQAYLGEQTFFRFLVANGKTIEDFDFGGWLNKVGGDDYDFLLGTDKIDVKTRSCNRPPHYLEGYEVIIDQRRDRQGNVIKKPMDYYVFALWVKAESCIWLLGWQTKKGFFEAPSYRVVSEGELIWPDREYKADKPIYLCSVRDLNPMATLPGV